MKTIALSLILSIIALTGCAALERPALQQPPTTAAPALTQAEITLRSPEAATAAAAVGPYGILGLQVAIVAAHLIGLALPRKKTTSPMPDTTLVKV